MRTTKMYINGDDMERLMETAAPKELYNAIGYLSQWGMQYPSCTITVADFKDPELVATYHREGESKPAYVIAAIWGDTTFSFHS